VLVAGFEKLAFHLEAGADGITGVGRKRISKERTESNCFLLQRGLQQRRSEEHQNFSAALMSTLFSLLLKINRIYL
jgi:hypothetical protein